MQEDEKSLLRRLADERTQRAAFRTLVERYSEPLYRQIRRMVLSHDDADDVLQNTFLKAWQGLPTFEGRSQLSSWLYRIAYNEAVDFLRHRRQGLSLSADDGEGMSVAQRLMADEYFDGDETAAQLQQAIQQLPTVQRTVFQMKYFDDMRYSDISRILGTTEGALKASYHIAVRKISEFFASRD